MSRLDAITLFVILACLLAIAFLIYRATDMFKDGKSDGADPIEQLRNDLEETDETTIQAEAAARAEREAAEQRAREAAAARANANTNANTGSRTDADQGPGAARGNTTNGNRSVEIPSTFNRRPGDYLVLAGSFKFRHNAENHAENLRGKGYSNATMTIFNGGTYAVVLVDRFPTYNEAQRVVNRLTNDGVEALVLQQRGNGIRG